MTAITGASSQLVNMTINLDENCLSNVFEKFFIKDLSSIRLVCKLWNETLNKNKSRIYKNAAKATFFDTKEWKKFIQALEGQEIFKGCDFDSECEKMLSDDEILAVLQKVFQGEENKGITFLKIPKGLTINTLRSIEQISTQHLASLSGPYLHIHVGYCDIPIQETYVVAMPHFAMKNSQKLSFEQQKALIKERNSSLPRIIEMIALRFLTPIPHSLPGFSRVSMFTRCEETVRDVGGIGSEESRHFKASILDVHPDKKYLVIVEPTPDPHASESLGAMAVQRFEPINGKKA
ncbi:F-box protein [Candidatus Protochlamydia phocaeensis]|uniref:F-box protein n=1 Tax=Candidatus Protochlamydia phocaeensis TaxID=1414722 RepID=UPI000837FB2E|nr:F-box protein [Candidatus Protochlamydia phocaeensis]